MIRLLIILMTIILSSCSYKSYDNVIRADFPNGSIYKISDRMYLMEKDGVIYFIEYFKGEKFIVTTTKL